MSRSKKEKQEIPSNWSSVVVDVGLLVKVLSLYVDIEYTIHEYNNVAVSYEESVPT